MKTKQPLRVVLQSHNTRGPHYARNAYTKTLKLECGHQVARKASLGTPRRLRCPECPPVISVVDETSQHERRVTITRGIRGYFAVLLCWNTDHGGFWEPGQSGVGSYVTAKEAEPEAKSWAQSEGATYAPPAELAS